MWHNRQKLSLHEHGFQLSFIVMNPSHDPFAPQPGYDGVIVRFTDKRWYLRHWHSHPVVEINLVVRGTGSVMLEDRKYPLVPGNLVWLWPGQRHMPVGWSSDMLMWIIEWHHDYLHILQKARNKDDLVPAQPETYWCRNFDTQTMQYILGILGGVSAMKKADTFNKGLQFALLAIWDEFIQATPVENMEFLHPKLERVLAQLNNPSGEMSLGQLARNVKMSPYYLSTLFREQLGLTIPEYRNRQRLNRFFGLYRAKPEIRLLELALEAGFGSYAQFYRIFTKAVGQTPQSWGKATQE